MLKIIVPGMQKRNVVRTVRGHLVSILVVQFYLLQIVAPASADIANRISFRDKIYDIAINGDEVFVVGFPGILLYSADRGDRFSYIKVPTNDALFAIDLASDGLGVIVGRDGLVLISRDGGKRWTKSDTHTKEHLFGVSVAPDGKIWAVGHFGTIIHSANGGKSWKTQRYDSTLPEPREEAELNQRQSDELTAEEENQGAIDEARLNAVTFIDASKGWIVGEFGLVLHTKDGGKTWKRQRSNVDLLMFAIRAIDAQTLVAVGSEGTLIESEDGGLNWKSVHIETSENLFDVYQLGNRRTVVGNNGLIMIQQNRGNAFRRFSAGVYSWIGSIAFIDERTGFAAGGRGYLLQTTDGGASWHPLSEKQSISKPSIQDAEQ